MANLPDAAAQALRERENGSSPNGSVTIRDFDQGVVETLGARIHEVADVPGYYLIVPGVEPPPSLPGVPVQFGNSEVHVSELLPSLVITRDDLAPAMARWSHGSTKYRAPKPGTVASSVVGPGGVVKTGYPKMVTQAIATPYDISYTLQILHARRGAQARLGGLALLAHMMRVYQPYTFVKVIDSIGDARLYFATTEAVSSQDELTDVADRVTGWSFGLTVEAELDLSREEELQMVQSRKFNFGIKEL